MTDVNFTVGVSATKLSTVNGGDVVSDHNVHANVDSSAGNDQTAVRDMVAGRDIHAGRDIIADRNIVAPGASFPSVRLAWRTFASLPAASTVQGTIALIYDAAQASGVVSSGGGSYGVMVVATASGWYIIGPYIVPPPE